MPTVEGPADSVAWPGAKGPAWGLAGPINLAEDKLRKSRLAVALLTRGREGSGPPCPPQPGSMQFNQALTPSKIMGWIWSL